MLRVFTLLFVVASSFISTAFPQERSQGISLHMLPKRVAEIGGSQWGFTVDGKQSVLQTAEEVLNYFRQQKINVQQNGIWIVTTSPDAYSNEELKVLEEVKSMCWKEKIPLFVCRASQLPNGWMRFDR
jgi:hypothetical protein